MNRKCQLIFNLLIRGLNLQIIDLASRFKVHYINHLYVKKADKKHELPVGLTKNLLMYFIILANLPIIFL